MSHLLGEEKGLGCANSYQRQWLMHQRGIKETSTHLEVRNRRGLWGQFLTCQDAGIDEAVPHTSSVTNVQF